MTTTRLIDLTGRHAIGKHCTAVVDAADFNRVAAFNWKAKPNASGKRVYAARSMNLPDGRCVLIRLHRFILDIAPGEPVDVHFINGDPLDCRRANLRVSSRSETVRNAKDRKRFARCLHCRSRFAYWSAAARRDYCSDGCRHAAHRAAVLAHREAARPAPVIVRCEHCGHEFARRTTWQRFCGESCKKKSKWRRRKSLGPSTGKNQAGNSRRDLSLDTGTLGPSLPDESGR